MERAATTASSLEAEQDSSGPRCQVTILRGVKKLKLGLRLHLNSLMIHLSQEFTRSEIALVDEAHGRMHDADMFRVDDLEGNEVIVDVREKTIEKEVSTADPVTTAGEVVTTASVEDSAAPTTATTADV
nr:hypothetical protein [Tanacetum cinerariifolium]